MDDAEVTRQAIGMSWTSWVELEAAVKKSKADADVLSVYLKQCPFISSSSPALKAAMETLQRAPKGRRTAITLTNRKATEEATRAAWRITISTWSSLLVQTETLSDLDIIQKYIQHCPFVNANSETKMFLLEGLTTKAGALNLPPLDGVESDSEESVEKSKKMGALPTKTEQPNEPMMTTATTTKISKQSKSNWRPLLFLIRAILLDLPMALLFAAYLGLSWARRVDTLYIQPAMAAAVWTDERAEQEITYYERHCTAQDMSTQTADDLLVPANATVQEASEHQLLHGFSIFQGVLTEDVMHDLRTYVDAKNRKLTEEESIFVIEGDNRFSFGLGTEEPCVALAVKQLATNMGPALEKVLGKNPALIEMTAITSSYGAINQYWHDDVIASASAMKYGRSFGPSYSVFIQLQNTTRAMGATDTCPGSHKCSSGNMEEFCEREGFQAVNSRTGFWKAGDALLMNMNSYHRGTAHTDPNAPDRVMLILTFVPKPEERSESRQLSQGITFSLRWDMWGHTLWDLQEADKRMKQPWATLRALGLYKPKDAAWGVDYVSSALLRMANEDNGFRRDELDAFLERGGFPWLPQFLHGQVKDNENWHEFLVDTVERCLELLGYINIFVVSLYGISLVVISALLSPKHFGLRGLRRLVARLILLYALLFAMWLAANHHVDNTDWARDIRAGRKYSVDFGAETLMSPGLENRPSTLPHRNDVLIETRYGSRQFHMYNDFTNDHPGTRALRKLVRGIDFAYGQVNSDFFQSATAAYVVSAVQLFQGRFLLQRGNEWLWLSDKDAIAFVNSELALESTPVSKRLKQEIRFLESDYKYGAHRNTSLAVRSLGHLDALKNKILEDHAIFRVTDNGTDNSAKPNVASFSHLRQKVTPPSTMPSLSAQVRTRSRTVNIAKEPIEPTDGAWIKSGDAVEGNEFLEDGASHWYRGVLHKVSASGDYFITYDDDSYGILAHNFVRAYEPYYVGEELEVLMGDDTVDYGTIETDHGDGTFDVWLDEHEERVRQVPTGDLRRLREDEAEEERVVRNHYA